MVEIFKNKWFWVAVVVLVVGTVLGVYYGITTSSSSDDDSDTNKPSQEGIKTSFRSSTLGDASSRATPTDRYRAKNRSQLKADASDAVNKYVVPTNITGKVAAAILPFECAMTYDAENFDDGFKPPNQQEFEQVPPSSQPPPPPPPGSGPSPQFGPNPPGSQLEPPTDQDNLKEGDDDGGKKSGIEIIGTYRPDQGIDQMTFYDFDLKTGADVVEGQKIQMPDGVVGCPARMMIMLFAYIDIAFSAFGKSYTVRIAMSDYDPLGMIRGDKLLYDDATATFRWYDLKNKEFTTTRPDKPQVIPGIRDFVRMDKDKTVFYPLHVLLKQQADFTNVERMEGVSVDVDFELQKFIVIVGEGDRTEDDPMEDDQLLALTSIVQADFEFNHGGRDVHGNGRPPPLDELPFDHHFMPTDDQGLPVPFGGFQIDPQGTLVHPGGFAPPFVPGDRDQVYPGSVQKSTTQTTTSIGGRVRESRVRGGALKETEPEEEFVAHLDHLDGWDGVGPPPPPPDFNWVSPPPGQFFVPNGFYDGGFARPPPPPSFMPPPESYAFDPNAGVLYDQLGVMPDGTRFGPPPPKAPPIPPPFGCGCGADPFKGMPGLFATVDVTMYETI